MFVAIGKTLRGRATGLFASSVFGLALSGAAYAYDKANGTNNTGLDVQVQINYAACRSDTFMVHANSSAVPTPAGERV